MTSRRIAGTDTGNYAQDISIGYIEAGVRYPYVKGIDPLEPYDSTWVSRGIWSILLNRLTFRAI